jgi:hypothetical protein
MFTALWLGEIVPATIDGTTPEALRRAGLLTNPVHVLDLGVLLPAAVVAGVLLRRRRPWGYCLAGTVLGCMVFLSLGIVASVPALDARGAEASWALAAVIGALAALEAVVLVRFLGGVRDGADVAGALR